MRHGVQFAHLHDEVRGVIALVGAEGDPPAVLAPVASRSPRRSVSTREVEAVMREFGIESLSSSLVDFHPELTWEAA
jgi:hypothetical protein